MSADVLERLREVLQSEGGQLSASLAPSSGADPGGGDGAAQWAAAGPRARGHAEEYQLLLEMILEGSLLHYGQPRVLRVRDPDLALLLGDQLYALGLQRLAALGDVQAVGELGDVISLLAQAHARSQPALAAAIWAAGAGAVGWGSTERFTRAKMLAQMEDPRAEEAFVRLAGSPDSDTPSGGISGR